MVFNTGLPVLVTEIIDENQIGAFSSLRMLLFTFGQAVASMIIPPIVKYWGYLPLLILASGFQAVCGVGYFIAAKAVKANKSKKTEQATQVLTARELEP